MANDFSQDDTCVALWRFESGALTTDSKGTNTLSSYGTPTADTSDYKEGSGCVVIDVTGTPKDAYDITDTALDAGFPFKYGDTKKEGTFCGWIKPAAQSGSGYIWSKYYAASVTFIFFRVGTQFIVQWGDIGGYTGINIPDDEWCHVGLVLDGINKTVYLRVFRASTAEIYEFSDTSSAAISLYNTAYFGISENHSYSNYFNGKLDENVVFNRLLLPDEIDQIRLGTFTGVDVPFELKPQGIYYPHTETAYSFTDGFESGDTSNWDDSADITVATGTTGMSGTYAAHLTAATSFLQKDITGFRNEIDLVLKFLSETDGDDSGYICSFWGASGILASVYYSYNFTGRVYCSVHRGNSGGTTIGDFDIPYATVSTLKIRYIPNTAGGTFQVWADDVSVLNFSGNTGTFEPITTVVLGDNSVEEDAARFFADDVSITDTPPPMNYHYAGNIPLTLVPTGTYSRNLSITTTITVLGGLEMGSDAVPVFITPSTFEPIVLGELRIGGNPDVQFIKPKVFLASTSGGFSLGGKFVSVVETEATAASITFYWPSVGGFAFGGVPATEFVAPTPYLVSVSGGFKIGGTFISDVNFVAPLDIAVASPARPGGYLVLGSDSEPIFITPHPPIYTVPDDPGLITGLVLGGGGGVAFIVPQIFVAIGGGEIALESEPIAGESEVYDTYVLNGNVYEPSVFTGFRFNSYGLYKNKAYGANAAGVYLLEGVDDDGEEIHTGVRIGPINFGTDHPKRLRSIHIGEAGENTRANVIVDEKNGEPAAQAIFSVNGDHRRIPVDISIQGVDYIIELEDFKTLSHLEIIPMMLWRK